MIQKLLLLYMTGGASQDEKWCFGYGAASGLRLSLLGRTYACCACGSSRDGRCVVERVRCWGETKRC